MKKLVSKIKLLLLLSMVLCTIIGQVSAQQLEPKDIEVLFRQKVPMRDGINLSANIFKPINIPEPLPAIIVLTPYNNDHNTKRGIYFATNGYVFITVDVRGRGDSEGVFIPFEDEGENGYDAVEWIASQPWCNGKVATMGGSYKGMDQYQRKSTTPGNSITNGHRLSGYRCYQGQKYLQKL